MIYNNEFAEIYGIDPRTIMRDSNLTIEAKVIFCYFRMLAGASGKAWPKRETILNDLAVGKNRYYKHANTLIKQGLITCLLYTSTVGNVDIELEEPSWDPEAAKNITPMMEIAKDPQIENIGANPAYVFAVVTVPRANVETAAADGSHIAAQVQDLFTYSVNADWKEVKKETTDGSTIYTYAVSYTHLHS